MYAKLLLPWQPLHMEDLGQLQYREGERVGKERVEDRGEESREGRRGEREEKKDCGLYFSCKKGTIP